MGLPAGWWLLWLDVEMPWSWLAVEMPWLALGGHRNGLRKRYSGNESNFGSEWVIGGREC